MKATIAMKVSNRKAKDERESRLAALEAYANLGDTPEHWKRFRLKYSDFFPENLRDWIYKDAESIYRKFKDSGVVDTIKFVMPPLLFYSRRLRLVWSRNDPNGVNLRFLYGLEKDLGMNEGPQSAREAQLIMTVWPIDKKFRELRSFIPGQPLDMDQQTTVAGLPPGKPVVNGITGAIDWEFGCAFQQSVYDLMQQRWRAMVCPECGKFFLADKPNQKFCSTACFGEVKRKRALAHWRAKGSRNRKLRMAKGKE